MKIEDLLLTVEQMNHLKELGVKVKDTALCWCRYKSDDYSYPWNFCKGEDRDRVSVMEYVPTLTLQEVLEMLPEEIRTDDNDRAFLIYDKEDGNISYNTEDCDGSLKIEYVSFHYGENILVDAYKALCWCAENGYLNKE